jgi:sterol desaturase/sphingolipid hydroxylase (fatty acid hydroxylase superfamily)
MELLLPLLGLRDSLLAAPFFIALERVFPTRRQKIVRPDWLNDAAYLVFNRWFISFGITLLLLPFVTYPLIPAVFRATVAKQSLWVQIGEIFLLADLIFYLVHRAFHTVPVLWRFHAIHHSIEHMDWLAGSRVHPVDQILTKGGSIVACTAVGFSGEALGVYALVYFVHSVLLHSNVRISFGPLRWLIASPQFHHWHHSREPQAWNKNFAGQLPFIDILFGTAYIPAGEWTPSYGIEDAVPRTYVAQLAHPFRRCLTGDQPAYEPGKS